jgi:hypothetical protein
MTSFIGKAVLKGGEGGGVGFGAQEVSKASPANIVHGRMRILRDLAIHWDMGRKSTQ